MLRGAEAKNRIFFIDELRGLAVLCMVFYHAFHVFASFFAWTWAEKLFDFFMPVQPLFAGIFIFLCGISCSFSKSNLKRGLILLGVALGLTLVTAVIMPLMGFVECEIYFGILHLLSVSILIFTVFSKLLWKIPPFAGTVFCVVIYIFTSGIGKRTLGFGEFASLELPNSLYGNNYLMPLGIHSSDFFSADYFPLLPNVFVFIAGVFSGMLFMKKGYPEWTKRQRIPFFGFFGRNALLVYIVHMPVLYGLGYIVNLLLI